MIRMLRVVWSILTFPFRLIAWVVELIGRSLGVVLGFALMVVGIAICSGSLLILGIPVFVIGLLVTLRCLG
jgi:hypothetical protein